MTVQYATSNGTAIAGTNYTSTDGTLTFNQRANQDKSLSVPLLNNGLWYNYNHTFTVSLSNPTGGYSLGTPNSATCTIIEGDVEPTIDFSASDDKYFTRRIRVTSTMAWPRSR